jgi:hypothetical protein
LRAAFLQIIVSCLLRPNNWCSLIASPRKFNVLRNIFSR